MINLIELETRERRYFLSLLRTARYAALEDAENFTEVCFVLEELGQRLHGKKANGLGQYQDALTRVVPQSRRDAFASHLRRLIEARNDKSHRGVYARKAVAHATAVGTTLEDCLMTYALAAEDLMVEGVIFAEPFMTLAKVRELMLGHSFSFLPMHWHGDYVLVSDYEVARVWRAPSAAGSHPLRYATLEQLLSGKLLQTRQAKVIPGDTALEACVQELSSEPWLIRNETGHIVGLLSAFDWL